MADLNKDFITAKLIELNKSINFLIDNIYSYKYSNLSNLAEHLSKMNDVLEKAAYLIPEINKLFFYPNITVSDFYFYDKILKRLNHLYYNLRPILFNKKTLNKYLSNTDRIYYLLINNHRKINDLLQ